jgi:MATE family multidrug resistance protein
VSLAFMVPLGLSLAVSLRISRAQGEGRGDALRPIGFGALLTGLVIMVGFALAFALAGRGITAAFTPAADVARWRRNCWWSRRSSSSSTAAR